MVFVSKIEKIPLQASKVVIKIAAAKAALFGLANLFTLVAAAPGLVLGLTGMTALARLNTDAVQRADFALTIISAGTDRAINTLVSRILHIHFKSPPPLSCAEVKKRCTVNPSIPDACAA